MKYSIVEADITRDAEVIVKLWKKNLLGYKNKEVSWIFNKYSWYYGENPFDQDRIWFLKTDSNNNVGSLAIGSHIFIVNNSELMFGLEGNFLVNRDHRTLGPAVMLQRMACKQIGKGIDVAYSFPPKHAIPALKRAGFIKIGEKIRMAKMLKSKNFIKNYISFKPLASLFSTFVDLIITLLSKETWSRSPDRFVFRHIENFDEKFDLLWKQISHKYPVISKKKSYILKWRYNKCPYRDYKIFGIFEKEDQTLLSYIIYHIPEDEDGHAMIFDCLFDPDQNLFNILLSEFLKFLRKERFNSVSFEFFGSKIVKNRFAKYGFRVRPDAKAIMIYCGDDKQLFAVLKQPENWFLTAGDDNG